MITINPDSINENTDDTNIKNDLVSIYFPSLLKLMESLEESVRTYFKNTNQNTTDVEEDIKLIKHQLLREIWCIESYDDFFSFLESLCLLIIDPKTEFSPSIFKFEHNKKPAKLLYSSSFFGSVVESIGIAALSLTFEEGLKIWKAFMFYRKESEKIWELFDGSINYEHANHSNTMILPKTYTVEASATLKLYSMIDLSCMFQTQVSKLQRTSLTISEPLQHLLNSLSHSEKGLIPSAYHVEYLNSWRNADYDASFDALHRYFDYMMSNKRQYFYHYALLALASMHGSFGSNQEALRAIDEAILVARENKDLDCLNYLLTWLLNFMISKPELFVETTNHPSRTEIINFLRSKTQETKNSMLHAITSQFEATVGLLEGSDLTGVMEDITKSMFLILNLENVNETKSRFLTICQLFSAIWARIGYPELSKLYLDTAIDVATEINYQLDLGILNIRKAYILFFEGEIDHAFALMDSIKEMLSHDFGVSKKWKICQSMLNFYACLKKCQYSECITIIERIDSVSCNFDDQDTTNELIYLKALLAFRTSNVEKGLKVLTSRLSLMKENTLLYNHFWFVRFQTLYSQAFVSYTDYPERGLSILLNAINLAHRTSFTFNLCESILCLCKLILKCDSVGSIQDVRCLLSVFLPKILQSRNLDMINTSYYLLAFVDFYEMVNSPDLSVAQDYTKSIFDNLKKATTGYQQMCDYIPLKECFELQIEVSQHLSMNELQNETLVKLNNLQSCMRA
ncbi:hypothetical protein CANINC_001049 [Pichia inconspicua]|uniref:Anaphase-promoting complex subunit 5 n=1 Tax=Pichia inconspicua TaxID=52247 RepID=A0A4T0X5R2_9ASCO|nr:hypothetical protein CANINC_001049 [[Candida] inconspicua]